MDIDSTDPDRHLQRSDRPARDVFRILALRKPIHDEQELVASQPAHGVGAARDTGEAVRHLLDELITGPVPERIVDDLETVEIEHGDCEDVAVALRVRHRLCQAIIQQYPIRQTRQGVVACQVPQLLVGGFQPLGAGLHDMLQVLDLAAQGPLIVPLACQRVGALQHLDRLERLLDHQQLVGMIQTRYHLRPVVVRVRRADDHLHVRVDLPQALNGLQAVPTRRHAHIDERHRVGLILLERLLHACHTLLTLQGRVDLESRARRGCERLAQQQALGRQQLGAGAGLAA